MSPLAILPFALCCPFAGQITCSLIDVAKERGIVSENGAAAVSFAAMLKVAVDAKIGIGNPVADLLAAITQETSGLPPTSVSVLPIETVDETQFDGDDAPDAANVSPPPIALVGIVEASGAPWNDG